MNEVEEAVRCLLRHVGEDPSRDGLRDTPSRVARAWREMCCGYEQSPVLILERRFNVEYDEMVILRDIAFHSTCEHHMLPFSGMAHIGYLPGDNVVGLSKLARLVSCYAQRLQIQERLTRQIADSIMEHLNARGVGVVIEAKHTCMGCRGVKQSGSTMVTSTLLGRFKESAETRSEFLTLIGRPL